MCWNYIPVLVATNTAGDVPRSHEKHLAFVATDMAGNFPEVAFEISTCFTLTNVETQFRTVTDLAWSSTTIPCTP